MIIDDPILTLLMFTLCVLGQLVENAITIAFVIGVALAVTAFLIGPTVLRLLAWCIKKLSVDIDCLPGEIIEGKSSWWSNSWYR